MDWAELILAAVVGLGVGGWWQRRHASREAEKQRDHASAEARATRRFQITFDAYQTASKHLSKHELWINLTEPILGPAPDPPDLSPDEGWVDFGGMIAVTASDEVRDAMRAAMDAEDEFVLKVDSYRRWKRGGRQPVDSQSPGSEMHEARQRALAAIQHAQTVMRDELADL